MKNNYVITSFKLGKEKPTMNRTYASESGLMRGVRLAVEKNNDYIILRKI